MVMVAFYKRIQKEEGISIGAVDCDFWTHEYQELHKSAKNALLVLKSMGQPVILTVVIYP